MTANTEKLNVLVFGAGAIGGYVGGSLALHGHRVVFIERPHNTPQLKEHGLHLQLAEQNHHVQVQVATTLDQAFAIGGPFDLAILALKSYDTAEALKSMTPFAPNLPPVLCLQNGVDNEPAIAKVLGAEKVIAGTVTTAVAKDGPGRIRLERLRGVGLASTLALSARLAEAMNAAGLNARLYSDSAAMKWSKLLTNLLTNASCAILDLSPAEVMAQPKLFALEMRQLREAISIMRAQGLGVVDLPGTPVRALALGALLPAALARPLMARAVGRGRGGKMPSLHIDLHGGRGRSEVDWLNGAVVRAGVATGLDTPVNRAFNDTLQSLISDPSQRVRLAQNPQALLELASA